MSVSLYRWTEACEGDYCPGDCDYCSKNTEDKEEQVMTERERAFEWMDKLIEWRGSEPKSISRDFWECNSGDAENKVVLINGLPKLANIIGYPYVYKLVKCIGPNEVEAWFYYKGWLFHDFFKLGKEV